jgi:putative transposase
MVDEPGLPERGLLSVPDEIWDLAVRRAQVIGPLAMTGVVGGSAVEAAAAEVGLSRRQVYELLRRWRQGQGAAAAEIAAGG